MEGVSLDRIVIKNSVPRQSSVKMLGYAMAKVSEDTRICYFFSAKLLFLKGIVVTHVLSVKVHYKSMTYPHPTFLNNFTRAPGRTPPSATRPSFTS